MYSKNNLEEVEQPTQYYSPPMMMNNDKADLLDKIQPTNIIDKMFHQLRGESEINGVWIKDPDLAGRALTKKGAWDIVTLMLPVSSQNVSLSNLKDNEIRARALSIAKTAQEMCLRNIIEYGIKGTDQLRFVHEIIFSNTFITLKQSQNEGIRKLLGSIGSGEIGSNQQEEINALQNLFRK